MSKDVCLACGKPAVIVHALLWPASCKACGAIHEAYPDESSATGVRLEIDEDCRACDGTGELQWPTGPNPWDTGSMECPQCRGEGVVARGANFSRAIVETELTT